MPDKGLLGAAGSQPHAMSSRRRTGSSRGQRAWHDVRDACSLGLRQPFPAAQKRQAGSCCPRTRARARARAARRRRGPRSTKGRGAFLQGRRAGAPACAANRRRQRGSPVIACVLTQASIEPGRPHISSRIGSAEFLSQRSCTRSATSADVPVRMATSAAPRSPCRKAPCAEYCLVANSAALASSNRGSTGHKSRRVCDAPEMVEPPDHASGIEIEVRHPVWPPILAWVRQPEALGLEVRRLVRDDFLDGRGRLERAPRHRPQRDVPGGVDHRATLSVRLNKP